MYSSVIIGILERITILYCFVSRIPAEENKRKVKIAAIVWICIFPILKIGLFFNYITIYLLELLAMSAYAAVCFQKRKLWHFTSLFILYAILDLVSVVGAFLTFPIVSITKANEVGREILVVMFYITVYLFIIYFWRRRKSKRLKESSGITRVGTMLLLGLSECLLLAIRHIGYDGDYVMFYNIFLFAIIFSLIVLALWLFDKRQEQKKMQEMTAYAHRTREVIPSMSRVLNKLDNMPEHVDQTSEIIQELRMICAGDMDKTNREAAVLKTFETTECFALDGQLERYLEEAAEQGFELDIMVRASVKEILNEKRIEIYSLLQVIGDLYRNAYKAILKREKPGRILICFGYNLDGDYEISVHDNGLLFPEHVLQRLGERGVTTDGTGHGIADIFEVLEKNQISYILNQDLPEGSVFTKSISLVFDGQGDKRIKCR